MFDFGNKNFFQYYLVRDVHVPTRGTEEAAGIDFYVPYYTPEFLSDLAEKNEARNLVYRVINTDNGKEAEITLLPGRRVLIPSGVKCMIPKGTALIASNKSGVSTKKGLVFTAQVVDSDYSGEVHIGVANVSDEIVTIKTGEKLIQFVHTPVILSSPMMCPSKELFDEYHSSSKRKDKGFGSNIEINEPTLENPEIPADKDPETATDNGTLSPVPTPEKSKPLYSRITGELIGYVS